MSDITAGEIWARREAIETAGATLLGRILFEFARIDVNLGLCLVSLEGGARREERTKQVSVLGFSKRLDYLEAAVNRMSINDHVGRAEYAAWLGRAHAVRQVRNDVVHGRWGMDDMGEKLINIIGLPGAPDERKVEYGLDELEKLLSEMKNLQKMLRKLQMKWPL
jgi:hypothetical protein